MKPGNDETYSDAETERRRDTAIKRMLSTPPKPHSDSKVSRKKKAKNKGGNDAKRGRAKVS